MYGIIKEISDHDAVEGLLMRSLKRNLWKCGVAIISMLSLPMLMVWISTSVAHASGGSSGFAQIRTVTVQTTPTVDTTVTALQKEQLTQQIAQQQHTLGNWLWSNAAALLSTLVIVGGALFGWWRWSKDRQDAQDKELKDRQSEREKRAEERF